MLSKQSIRGNIRIILNGSLITKDQLIEISKTWSENQEILFRKLLKQGGKFRLDKNQFQILPPEKLLNSRGNEDSSITPMDHTGDEINDSYLK